MTTGSAAILPAATLDEDAWEDLLSFIEERQVIPIVRPELLQYVRLRSVLRDASFEPPSALRKLAAITDFDLLITTTCDSLLESAIDLERFAGSPSTDVLSYAPNRAVDLPVERSQLSRPVVYHLFGKRFKALHFTQLPGGQVTAEFAQRLAEFLRGRAR